MGFSHDSRDVGQPARYIHQVYDIPAQAQPACEHNEYTVPISPAGRLQIKIQVVRTAGNIRKLYPHRVPSSRKLDTILELGRAEAGRLVQRLRSLADIPIYGDNTVYIDDDLLHDLVNDPDASEPPTKPPPRRSAIEQDTSTFPRITVPTEYEVR